MNLWHPPTLNYKRLYLPLLTENLEDNTNIYQASSEVYQEISEDFVNVWQYGPKSKSPEALLDCIEIIGKTFCALIKEAQGKTSFNSKTRPDDLVTEVDTGLEMLFRLWVKKFLPEHKIIGEEGAKPEILEQDTVWYLDPVDGTNNYVKGKKDVGLNICCFKQGLPLISFVGAPFYEKYFYGTETKSYQENNGQKIKLSIPEKTESNLICTEIDSNEQKDFHILQNIINKSNSKHFQSKCIAMDLINFLEGNLLAFFKNNVKIWDIAAPLSLIKYVSNNFNFDFYVNHDFKDSIDFFSNDSKLLASLNKNNKFDSRFGLIVLTPKNRPGIRDLILNEYRNA